MIDSLLKAVAITSWLAAVIVFGLSFLAWADEGTDAAIDVMVPAWGCLVLSIVAVEVLKHRGRS